MVSFKICCLLVTIVAGQVGCLPDCDFDQRDHWCDWVQALDDEYQWKARQYPTFTPGTGPQGDHTLSGSGWYIYTDSRDAEDEGWTTRLISPVIEGSYDIPTTVMTFWYSMWDEMGTSMGTLNVYIMNDDMLSDPVWSRSGPKTKKGEWKQARIALYSAGPFKVVLEGVRGPGVASDIGIDDVSFSHAPLPTSCDFESSDFGPLCGFYQEDLADDFDWTLNAGETPSLDTGPLIDHTYGNDTGHYLFLETTRPDEEKTAQLKSFEYYKDTGRCTLEFYYHAFGPHVGGLNVFIQDKKTDFEISGNADTWRRETMRFDDVSGRYTIGFTGVRGNGNLGDIAIDDISISGPSCFAVDVCASNPCQNNAQCIPNDDDFICNCTTGWTGERCQLSVDECYSSPCVEPRVCVDLENGYECRCPEGLTGEQCNQPVTDEPPVQEPNRGIPPETVNIIVSVVVIAAIAILVSTSVTVYCTRQDKASSVQLDQVYKDANEGEGAFQMKEANKEEEKAHDNLAYENKLN